MSSDEVVVYQRPATGYTGEWHFPMYESASDPLADLPCAYDSNAITFFGPRGSVTIRPHQDGNYTLDNDDMDHISVLIGRPLGHF